MDRVMNLTEEILNTIYNSHVYKDYMRTKAIIDSNPQISNVVNSFKNKHLEYHDKCDRGGYCFDEERHLCQEYHKMILDEDVETYFKCEKELILTLSNIFGRVVEGCQLDIFPEV